MIKRQEAKGYIHKYSEQTAPDKKVKLPEEKNDFDPATIPGAIYPHGAIKKYSHRNKLFGSIIGKLCSSFYFVNVDTAINTVIDELDNADNIETVGVVDHRHQIKGLIIKKNLFKTLGSLYGRSLAQYKKVSEYTEITDVYSYNRNVYSISKEIGDALQNPSPIYYLLSFEENKYFGIFTNIDMMMYLTNLMQRDLVFARTVMQKIVSDEIVKASTHFGMVCSSKMAQGVGGDYYRISKIDQDRELVAIYDVSGKGVPASLVTSFISGMFSRYDAQQQPFHIFLKKLNQALNSTFENEKFVTGIILELNHKEGTIRYIDSGHGLFYLIRDRKVMHIKNQANNLPLGIMANTKFQEHKLQLQPGDMLLLCTDGFSEQRNSTGEEYGLKPLFYELINIPSHNEISLVDVKNKLLNDIEEYRGNHPQNDDMTLILIHYKGSSKEQGSMKTTKKDLTLSSSIEKSVIV